MEFRRVLSREVRKRPCRLFQQLMVTDLLKDGDRVIGAVGIDHTTGTFTVIKAKATILCTGGALRMYEHTTGPEELTGDGLAAVFRAGAERTDMEFPMFLPYILIQPPAVDGVDYTYLLRPTSSPTCSTASASATCDAGIRSAWSAPLATRTPSPP